MSANLPDPRKTLGADGNQSSGLTEHDLGRRGGDFFAKQAIALAAEVLPVRPTGKLIGRRHMADIRGATAHDKSEHHFRFAVLDVACVSHWQHL